jgi:hypothetical protein
MLICQSNFNFIKYIFKAFVGFLTLGKPHELIQSICNLNISQNSQFPYIQLHI